MPKNSFLKVRGIFCFLQKNKNLKKFANFFIQNPIFFLYGLGGFFISIKNIKKIFETRGAKMQFTELLSRGINIFS